MSLLALLTQGGLVSQLVAVLLLAMSVASWVVILWKAWLLHRAVRRCGAQHGGFLAVALGGRRLREGGGIRPRSPGAAADRCNADPSARNAGHGGRQGGSNSPACCATPCMPCCNKLQFGQILLATVGSTAPFVGLLGTVWGIYHALTGMATAGQVTIDKVSGPVGEALIMTAAGLAVAIPAVLAYNVFGRSIGRIEADLEGFAFDLRELLAADANAKVAAERSAGPPRASEALSEIIE